MYARLVSLLRWSPPEAGSPATPLSLTADEGTWIKLPDFKGHLNVILVFFRSGADAQTREALQALQAALPQLQETETAVFGVSTARTDQLRALRAELGLDYFLLYDPLAMAARGFRASGRIRPFCKDMVVVVGKDGNVRSASRGLPDVAALLAQLRSR